MANAKMNCSDSIASTCSTSTRSVGGSCLHNSMRSIDSSSNSTVSSRSSTNSVRFQEHAMVRLSPKSRTWKETKESWWTEHELHKIKEKCLIELETIQKEEKERPGRKATSLFGNKNKKKPATDKDGEPLTARGLELVYSGEDDPRLQQKKDAVRCMIKSIRRSNSKSKSPKRDKKPSESGNDDKYGTYYKQVCEESTKRAILYAKLDALVIKDYLSK